MDSGKPSRKPIKSTSFVMDAKQARHEHRSQIQKKKREELLWAHRDPHGERHLGMSNDHWQAFVARTSMENRTSLAGSTQQVRQRAELSGFTYDRGGTKVDHQVKYGPSANIKESDQRWLKNRFGANVGKRFSQYSSNRNTYVEAAKATGRALTEQERAIDNQHDPGKTSINHIIASGTGQNMMNAMALQHAEGVEQFGRSFGSGDQAGVLAGLAKQAASQGRMRAIGRDLLAEEAPHQGYGAGIDASLGNADRHIGKRNKMATDIRHAFEGSTPEKRLDAYKGFLKNTFDSTGNLRLGHGTGNGRVSTGFDMPLTGTLEPTPRGRRLYETNQNFGLAEMEAPRQVSLERTKFRAGIFTTNALGQKLSSSKE